MLLLLISAGSTAFAGDFTYRDPDTLYISTTGSDITGTGSWDNPFATIQHGINQTVVDEVVLVEPGTYVENIDFGGANITVGSHYLTTGDEDYINQTVIDGGGLACVATFAGGETSIARLSGFTLTNGFGPWAADLPDYRGGGISCVNGSNPTLDHLFIWDNMSVLYGGGIFCHASAPEISHTTITGNTYAVHGGAIYISSAAPNLTNLTVYDNISSQNNEIVLDLASPVISYLTLWSENNTGIDCATSDPVLDHVTLFETDVAIRCIWGAHPTLTNTILWDNNHEVTFHSEGTANSINIDYCDLQGGQGAVETNGNGTLTWGADNIDADPLFCDPQTGDFTLALGSPCLGAADDGTAIGAWELGECGTPQNVIHIATTGDDLTGDGSLDNPYATIQHGIGQAINGDTVLVADGTYVENIDFSSKDITVASWFLLNSNVSHIDDTIIDGGGIDCVVAFINGETAAAILCGFYITNGYGSDENVPYDSRMGGGITCHNSAPTLTDLKIHTNDTANDLGGCDHCAGWAGIYCYYSEPYIANSSVSYNDGGGVLLYHSDAVILNCSCIWNDDEDQYGLEAVVYLLNSNPQISWTHLRGHKYSTGLVADASDPVLDHVTIGKKFGGWAYSTNSMYLKNGSHVTMTNTIVWGITSYYWMMPIAFDNVGTSNSINISYTDIQLGTNGVNTNDNGTVNWGEGILATDPRFCEGDVFLAENSPCVGVASDGLDMGARGIGSVVRWGARSMFSLEEMIISGVSPGVRKLLVSWPVLLVRSITLSGLIL